MRKKVSLSVIGVILAATCILSFKNTALAKETAQITADNEMVYVADSKASVSEDAMLNYFEDKLYNRVRLQRYNSTAYREGGLTRLEKDMYNKAKEKVKAIAAGETDNMVVVGTPLKEHLGQSVFTTDEIGISYSIDSEDSLRAAFTAWKEKYLSDSIYDVSKVYLSVLADCPYECYWVGLEYTYGYDTGFCTSYNSNTGLNDLDIGDMALCLCFTASQDYAVYSVDQTEYYPDRLDIQKTKAVTAAAQNAQAIVAAVNLPGKTDYEKLTYYKNQLCSLTDYNYDAAESEGIYGDPWQVIYMFDQNPDTKVVCEGYSKSFKYLCDLTTFASDKIRCYTVSGYMSCDENSGGHMWNILHMEDGRNYLVDVTNCDMGGEVNDALFMAIPLSGSVDSEYVFMRDLQSITYTYTERTRSIYTDSELTYSTVSYEAGATPVYTIAFDANGGTSSFASKEVNFGDCYGELPDAERSGYRFLGWYTDVTDGTKVTETTECEDSITLYAHWEEIISKKQIKVVFDANGGISSEITRNLDEGDLLGTLPLVTREGYVFKGWFTSLSGGTKVTETMVCNSDVTLYARWEKIKVNNEITVKNFSKDMKASKQTVSLQATVKYAVPLKYSSSDSKVTVSDRGVVTIPKNYGGIVTITITSAETDSYFKATAKATITVAPGKVSGLKVKSSKKGVATVTWKQNKFADGYEIKYGQKKDLSKAKAKTAKKTAKTYTIKKLKSKSPCYVEISAYKKIKGGKLYSPPVKANVKKIK